MLARAGTAKKAASKFEDSDSSHMSRPRTMSNPPHRPATRVPPPRLRPAAAAAVGSEASGARHRALGAGRGTAPRSPLHEKIPSGAGSRIAELEAKLDKAHDQLPEMREQLAAAEKARKDARAAFVEAKTRFAAKQRDGATWAPVEDQDSVPAQQNQQVEAVTYGVTNGGTGNDETRSMSSPATVVLEPILSESENKRGQVDEQVRKTSPDGDDVNNNVADGEGKRGNPEADELRSKLEAKDREVYEVSAKLLVRDMEVNTLRMELMAKDTGVGELTVKLVAKDAEIDALRVDNAALGKTASEGAEAARETERALIESAAREARLSERLAASERAREALEAVARRSRVQSEQWRKAAEEAAAVLGGAGHHFGEPDNKDMRRHGSIGGSGGKIDNQDADGEGSGEKRKSGCAVQLLADLWKKKAPK